MVAAGGAGTQKSVGTGGGGAAEGRRTPGGEEPRGPRRFRTGKLVLPKSRHPSVRTPLRPRASEPGEPPEDPAKWTRAGNESPETGTTEPERAGRAERRGDPLPRTIGSRPADPERRRCGARSAGARQRRRAGALPASARSGRGRPAAAEGGGRGRRRRHSIKGRARRAGGDGAARTPPKFAACAARRVRCHGPHRTPARRSRTWAVEERGARARSPEPEM